MQPTEPPRQAPETRAGRTFGIRNWTVSRRLVALVLIPTLLAGGLGALRVYTAATSANSYSKVLRLGKLAGEITALVQEFSAERDQTAAFVAAGRPDGQRSTLLGQYARVDDEVGKVRALAKGVDGSYAPGQIQAVRGVINRLDGIAAVRSLGTDSEVGPITVVEKYSESIGELLAVLDGVTTGAADDTLARTARALGSISRAKEQASRLRALVEVSLLTGEMGPDEVAAAQAARSDLASEVGLLHATAPLQVQTLWDDTVIGTEVDRADLLRQQVLAEIPSAGGRLRLATPFQAAQWNRDQTAVIARMRTVEQSVAGDIVSRSSSRQDGARADAMVSAVLSALLLLLVLVITLLMANSLVRPLRRLRDGALQVAGASLPGLVHRLRDPEAAAGGIEVAPIEIDTTDEIGQVARAFDEVHREAVRLAANEAVLRGNINAMFVNLSRRSQSLIERQLRLIDELEQGERDDERLASLFRLDHLATRMRRNCENLLVLGGQEQIRRWNRPVPLLDVVRAALSEVEQYERVQLKVQGEVAIGGPVVNDLVHLVAELVENAISFSPEHTAITVSGHLVSGGAVMVQITDQGVGMTAEELADANKRLAAPPMADVSAARRMGLFVVGRLAARHGIRVELRSTVAGGVTAFALLPARAVGGAEIQQQVPAVSPPPAAPVVPAPRTSGQWSAVNQQPARGVFEPPPRGPAQAPAQSTAHLREPADPNVLARPIWRSAMGDIPAPLPAPAMTYADPKPLPAASHEQPPGQPPREPVPAPGWEPQGAAASGGWGAPPPVSRVERSPIFEAMTSEWFQSRGTDPVPESASWSSRGDAGWQAAQATAAPVMSGRTTAGLPKRVPGQNRVPGAVPQVPGGAVPQAPPGAAWPPPGHPMQEQPPPRPGADAVRARFGGLQRGVRRGRTEAPSAPWPSDWPTDHSETGEHP